MTKMLICARCNKKVQKVCSSCWKCKDCGDEFCAEHMKKTINGEISSNTEAKKKTKG